jgi:hypothetical protein
MVVCSRNELRRHRDNDADGPPPDVLYSTSSALIRDFLSDDAVRAVVAHEAAAAAASAAGLSAAAPAVPFRLVLVTYKSLPRLMDVMFREGHRAELILFDEGHRVLGPEVRWRGEGGWAAHAPQRAGTDASHARTAAATPHDTHADGQAGVFR